MITARHVVAEEWRGLVPLKSTRADVVRLFNECNDKESLCEFTSEKEEINIQFSNDESCKSVPFDTVLSIQRDLRNMTTFATLQLDKRRFKSFDPSSPRNLGYRGFIDDDAGLLVKTDREGIFQINYIAAKKDRPACPGYYARPREFVAVVLPHVMMVNSVTCPDSTVIAGEKVPIATTYPPTGQRISLTWESTGGRIIEGPIQRKIFLDTTGLEGKSVTVTVEVNDGFQHTATGSCTFIVAPRPKDQR